MKAASAAIELNLKNAAINSMFHDCRLAKTMMIKEA
jgi:hypothetical protein